MDAPPPSTPTPPPPAGPPPPPSGLPAADRARVAYQARNQTDYIFSFWTAFGWSVLTCGIFGFYVFYQLMRRMRDHNRRRLDLLEAGIAFAWEQAQARPGLADELRPAFERMAGNLRVLQGMTTEFRDPTVWTVLVVIGMSIAEVIAFILLDGDLVRHAYAERAIEYDLAHVYGRLGKELPAPGPPAKGKHNYVARVIVVLVTFGIYLIWWIYDMMVEVNSHFVEDWAWEDQLATAVYDLSSR